MNIYGVYKHQSGVVYWIYKLKKGYNIYFWEDIDGATSIEQIKELKLDGPLFLLNRMGGQVQEGDMECEFSPP